MERHRLSLNILFIWISIKSVSGESCDSMTDGAASACWYTFWYVWVAIALFLAVIITIVIVFYKHKTKRRNRVQRIGPTMPREPPPYAAPSQEPPAYDDAIKESIVVPANFHGDIRHIRAMQIRQNNERNHERQYLERQLAANRQPSDVSIISIPPAYVDATHPSQPMPSHPPTRQIVAGGQLQQQNNLNQQQNQDNNPQQRQTLPQRPARLGPSRPGQQQQQQQQQQSQRQQTQPAPQQHTQTPAIQSTLPQRPTRLSQQRPQEEQQSTVNNQVSDNPPASQPPPRSTTRR